MLALIQTIVLALDIYWWLLIASAIFSWLYAFNVVNSRNQFVGTIGSFLFRVTEPALRPIRRLLPDLGGIDISPIILLLIIFFLRQFLLDLGRAAGHLSARAERLLPACSRRHRAVRQADAARIEGRDRQRRDDRRRSRASRRAGARDPRQGQGQCRAGEAGRRVARRAAHHGHRQRRRDAAPEDIADRRRGRSSLPRMSRRSCKGSARARILASVDPHRETGIGHARTDHGTMPAGVLASGASRRDCQRLHRAQRATGLHDLCQRRGGRRVTPTSPATAMAAIPC